MKKSIFIRVGGWGLILAGVIFFLYILVTFAGLFGGSRFFLNSDLQPAFRVLQFVIIPLFMSVGLLALWARFGTDVGWVGRNVLLVGALLEPVAVYLFHSPAVHIAGITLSALYYGAVPALTLGQIFLALFGIAALKHKPLPRLNWLPLAAGAWFPVTYPLHFLVRPGVLVINESVIYTPNIVNVLFYIGACGQAAAMVLLGLLLQVNNAKSKNAT